MRAFYGSKISPHLTRTPEGLDASNYSFYTKGVVQNVRRGTGWLCNKIEEFADRICEEETK